MLTMTPAGPKIQWALFPSLTIQKRADARGAIAPESFSVLGFGGFSFPLDIDKYANFS